MRKIDSIRVTDGRETRTISFWEGNPADIPAEDPVDMVIVSAFPNDYTPTPRSIIGALHRRGLSVAGLAQDKAVDLRPSTGFWLSQMLSLDHARVGAKQILCFEPQYLGDQPAEVVGTLFRGLFPFLRDDADATIAMAVIATGALGEAPDRMLRALVTGAAAWMEHGMPIRELRIMEPYSVRVRMLEEVFADLKATHKPAARGTGGKKHDLFLSFAEEDGAAVDVLRNALGRRGQSVDLFDYRHSIDPGMVWQEAIDEAMQSCRKMVAFLTPDYFNSEMCIEELGMARVRHRREGHKFLFPMYVRSLPKESDLPLWLQAVYCVDCRTVDPDKIAAAARRILPT